MPSASEALGQQSQLAAALRAGIDNLSLQQTVVFTQYAKSTMPLDGFVFWVATANTLTAKGSLHYATDRMQEEDQTIAVNHMIFTAEAEITEFNAIAPGTIWVGNWNIDGATLQVAFSRSGPYYRQADVWHYVGDAVNAPFASQLVASSADLPTSIIVSNSLPIWLSQNTMAPVYASFLVPDNVRPPYIVAHVEPVETQAVQSFPVYTWPGDPQPNGFQSLASSQLMRDRVRLTLYGFTSQQAMQYLAALVDYSLTTDAFGFMSNPAIRDEKLTQVEVTVIAQKKTIEILASYYLSAADVIAKRLILSAAMTTVAA